MFKSKLKKKSNVQILPMIDVIFFLLVFFMLFTTFKTTPTGLEINLPQAKTVTSQEEDLKIILDIGRKGELYFEGEEIDATALEFQVSKIIKESPKAVFIINADKEVRYEKIIKVMDQIRNAGGYRLALSAKKEKLN